MATIHPAPALVYYRSDGADGLELVIKTGAGPEMLVYPMTLERIASHAAQLAEHLKTALSQRQLVNAIGRSS
jgi:hypothetical protein